MLQQCRHRLVLRSRHANYPALLRVTHRLRSDIVSIKPHPFGNFPHIHSGSVVKLGTHIARTNRDCTHAGVGKILGKALSEDGDP